MGDEPSHDELLDMAKSRVREHFVLHGHETRRCTTSQLHAIIGLPLIISGEILDEAIDAVRSDGDLVAQVTIEADRKGSKPHGRVYSHVMPRLVNA